ncbi:hypothetical protein [Paenibacillus xylaniclasticus]|uniref:hypothetical protein n=1 Tax=Paenibacillus xylaniclasticus TaxID=588083 RepID=UPI000FD9FD25|nr:MULTISPECIES: hypothetical protein [Paenibacillus]GFN29843.1 hypothetical protein PCURB6_01030 [Paenibacillus curdlanolyticus]
MKRDASSTSPVYSRAIRIRILSGMAARLSIYSVDGKVVQSKATSVLVTHMSPDSIEFMSHLKLPVGPRVLLQFDLELLDWQFRLTGHTDWQRREDNLYRYRCSLTPEPSIRRAIVQALCDVLQQMNPEGTKVHFIYRMMVR